jgi:signal transduction histidine kinase
MGEVKPQPVPLQHAVSEAIHLLEQEIQKTGAELSIHLPEVEILATPTFLSQVFLNLISNGIKFVPQGRKPEIKISAEIQDETIRISVSDNGIGIEERFYEKIFKVFERVHTDKNISGTGIGLAIVKEALERMGGKISVSSVLEKGSTFIVTLPILSDNHHSRQHPHISLQRESQKHAA